MTSCQLSKLSNGMSWLCYGWKTFWTLAPAANPLAWNLRDLSRTVRAGEENSNTVYSNSHLSWQGGNVCRTLPQDARFLPTAHDCQEENPGRPRALSQAWGWSWQGGPKGSTTSCLWEAGPGTRQAWPCHHCCIHSGRPDCGAGGLCRGHHRLGGQPDARAKCRPYIGCSSCIMWGPHHERVTKRRRRCDANSFLLIGFNAPWQRMQQPRSHPHASGLSQHGLWSLKKAKTLGLIWRNKAALWSLKSPPTHSHCQPTPTPTVVGSTFSRMHLDCFQLNYI